MDRRLCAINDQMPGASFGEQVDFLTGCGFGAVEVRSLNGRSIVELDRGQVRAMASIASDVGVDVAVVDTPIGGPHTDSDTDIDVELETLDRFCDAADVLGARRLRVMSYPRSPGHGEARWRDEALSRLDSLLERAKQHDVRLLHENCVGWGATVTNAATLFAALPDLGCLFDLGNGATYGYESSRYLDAVLTHVEHVHVKDAVLDRGQVRYTLPGAGDCELATCVRTLSDAGYSGCLSAEPDLFGSFHTGTFEVPGDDAARALTSQFLGRMRTLATDRTVEP